jgi:hypothetical protein
MRWYLYAQGQEKTTTKRISDLSVGGSLLFYGWHNFILMVPGCVYENSSFSLLSVREARNKTINTNQKAGEQSLLSGLLV